MGQTITFFPEGNAECIFLELDNGKRMLMDYANMHSNESKYTDLTESLKDIDTFDVVMFTHPAIRSTFSSVGEPDHVVMLTLGMLLRNMIPLVVICVLLALGLKFFPNGMVKGFMVFGKLMTGALTLVLSIEDGEECEQLIRAGLARLQWMDWGPCRLVCVNKRQDPRVEGICKVLERRYPTWREDEKARRRAMAALQRLGYSFEQVRAVMGGLDTE